MADRKNKGTRGEKSSSSGQTGPPRQSTFFISGEGIDREVITTDICRYLGNDALVKPGAHVDKNTGRSQEGFYITAYRPPTSAQLADLRADSQKWREERRNSARPQVEYGNSATRQEAMRTDKIDDNPRPGGGIYASGYGQMGPPAMPPGPTRTEFAREGGGFGPQIPFAVSNSAIPPVSSPGAYPNPRGGYSTTESTNYTYSPMPNQPPFNPMDSRDRMETAPSNPTWSMPSGTGYPPSANPHSGAGYAGRSTFTYTQGVNPAVPAGYGRGEPPISYGGDAYGPRDSGIPPSDAAQGEYYNDDDMDYEEPAAPPAPTHTQSRRGDRDSRERHDEPRRKGHGHR